MDNNEYNRDCEEQEKVRCFFPPKQNKASFQKGL